MIDLGETNLFGANFKRINLERANLMGTKLEKANLKRANLHGANLEGAKLEGANLKGALNLSIDQLSKVKTLSNAKLDDELLNLLREERACLFKS